MSHTKWRGIFPAVRSKFKDNDDLGRAAMEKHFSVQIDAGLHGLVSCGSLGEASTLPFDESLEVTPVSLYVANKHAPTLRQS